MKHTTTETLPGEEVTEVLGVARGNTVRARNVGRDITQAIRNLLGGELKAYSELFTDTRDQAIERMLEDAREMDADAVVNVRFETSQVAGSSAELLAYGTAVELETTQES
ncbi:MAG: YbjQ family protein [Halobacteriales archaeon]